MIIVKEKEKGNKGWRGFLFFRHKISCGSGEEVLFFTSN